MDEQHLIADSSTGEVITCRDVKQRPKEMRFSFTEFDAAIQSCSFVGSPPRSAMTKQFAEVALTQREEIVPKYKSFQCKEKCFMEYGFTPGCAGCQRLKRLGVQLALARVPKSYYGKIETRPSRDSETRRQKSKRAVGKTP